MENLDNTHLPKGIQDKLIKKLKSLNPREIWIFGSYAKGNPKPSSDIDLFVIKKKIKKDFHEDIVNLRNELNKLGEKYGIDIDLFIDTKDLVEEKLLDEDEFYTSVFDGASRIYTKKDGINISILLQKKSWFDKIMQKVKIIFMKFFGIKDSDAAKNS
ncbi:nucleotidyltransferase family protein [Campylobacter ureolyticus]|uniref:Nucleotidyltransferase domain-containing protein n=1 Tax=Campylobacter ureolyticus TaxID=827 RepID=A0A9Q4KNC5_9BACT|nr:nucleotidyltransferase domain-containing protein [Campylobacter ureolyticus]MCZ6134201.1 nucleotidyltransferase domain-containing protein [Campylobacter ureolyticus]MCZ6161247.1 nucleotidyltransferase domain-containing protein [Campylobacter ureolyticus]MCZ6170469.1 nucleotidyltransferase domain-containing protein [Campylobacter ureolyticus]